MQRSVPTPPHAEEAPGLPLPGLSHSIRHHSQSLRDGLSQISNHLPRRSVRISLVDTLLPLKKEKVVAATLEERLVERF